MRVVGLLATLVLGAKYNDEFQDSSSDVAILNPTNFDKVVDGSKHVLVEFYAPWCGHCKSLAPVYELVASSYKKHNDIIIAKVDADEHKSLGQKVGVTGFPTLKWFPKGSTTAEDYNGGREEDAFYDFIAQKTGIKAVVKKVESAVTILSSSTFDEKVLESGKSTLVEFYAPWCGHCKSLAPIYEQVAQAFQLEKDCIVANLDATKADDVASKYGVSGYPTIKFFKADGEVIEYMGGRTKDDFVKFLNEKCGTFRKGDGSLTEQAGRDEKLDEFVGKFVAASTADEKTAIIADAKKYKKTLKTKSSAYYIKALEKALKKQEYPLKESTRLNKMLDSGNTSLEKRDEFTKRVNILNMFLKTEGDAAVVSDEL